MSNKSFFAVYAQYSNHDITPYLLADRVEAMKDVGCIPFHGTEEQAWEEANYKAAEELDAYNIPYSVSRGPSFICDDCGTQCEDDECHECGSDNIREADMLEEVIAQYVIQAVVPISEQEYFELGGGK